jgi:hypothetical protein
MVEQQDGAPHGGNRFKHARQQVLGDLFGSPRQLHAHADLDDQFQASRSASIEAAQQEGLRLQRRFVHADRSLTVARARS